MSGVEVVGVVLTVIPLITAALAKYEETASTFRNSPKEFRNVNRGLKVEVAILKNGLQKLLDDTDLDDQVKLELMEDVAGKRWSDQAVQDVLENRLTNSFDVYLETVCHMNSILEEFKKLLMLGAGGEVPFEDKGSFKDLYKRFSFARKKSAYMDLIQEMHEGNLTLVRLTEHVSSTHMAQTIGKKRVARLSKVPNFGTFRERATAVFYTLQDRLSVSCKATHRVSLNLKDPDEVQRKPKASVPPSECIFRLVVHHSSLTSSQTPALWQLEEAEIRSLNVTTVDNLTSAVSMMALQKQSDGGKPRKSVKWAKASAPDPTLQTSPGPKPLTGDEIKDLCASIKRLRATQCGACFGYIVDSSSQRHGIYKPDKLLIEPTSSTVLSLGTLLATRKTRQGESLTRADSRRLALSLAYGVLRLHNTPWLRDQWSGDDIVLFEQNNKIAADHPFVSADPAQFNSMGGAALRKTISNPAIRSQTVFALAIVLIELCMRKQLQDLQVPEDLNADGTKHAMSDYFTAVRLLSRVEEKAGTKYGDAVKCCLKLSCDLDYAKPTLENEEFRRAVYEDVVAVLEEDVSFSWSNV